MLKALKIVWFNAAILVTLLAGLELAGFMYYTLRSWTSPEPQASSPATPPQANWTDAYVREFNNPGLGTRWTPYVYWRRRPFSGQFITVDDRGLRRTWSEPRDSAAPADDVVDVAVFGGSSVWGTGARDAFTIPSQLAKRLARDHPGQFRVTNYGETGYVSTQSALTLLREIQSGHIPDVVVFYEGFNDVYSAFQNAEAGLPQNETNRVREFNLLSPERAPDLYWEVLSRSNTYALARGIHRRIVSAPPPSQPDFRGVAGNAARIYLKNLDLIRAMAATWGFRPRFYWQPTVFSKASRTAAEERLFETSDLRLFYEDVIKGLPASPLNADHGDFQDLSHVFDSYADTAFLDEVHTTEAANELVATRMAADLAGVVRGHP